MADLQICTNKEPRGANLKEIKNLTKEAFSRYGHIIEADKSNPESFQVVLSVDEKTGWRIAVKTVENKYLDKLGLHPDSMETFEPLIGTVLICAATEEKPEDYEVFLLDKPVCIYANIWHGMITLSEYSQVKICENNVVDGKNIQLNSVIRPVLDCNPET